MTVETINPNLCKSAVLAVVLCPYTRLEVQSLGKADRLRYVEELGPYYIYKIRGKSPLRFVSVCRNHYLVKSHVVGLQLEVQFLGSVFSYRYFQLLLLVANIRSLDSKDAIRQVFQKIVSCIICGCGDGRSLHLYNYVW